MRKVYSLYIFLLFLTSGCNNSTPEKDLADQPTQNVIIDLLPFDDVPNDYVKFIHEKLSKTYGLIEIRKNIDLPSSAYYIERNRYRADTLINFLKTITPKGHVTLGLTTKDISHTKGTIKDYGIMGLGFQPGPSCVVSTFRLSKKNVLEQYFKLSLHELGHTQGLPHCADTTCYMRDCGGKNHWDEEKDFCDKCKLILTRKGWTFNN